MPGSTTLRTWIAPIAWSVGLLTVVLVGTIVSVKMLSDRDAITLAGGIAVFVVSISAWFAVTAAMVARRIRTVKARQVEERCVPPREVPRPPLVHR